MPLGIRLSSGGVARSDWQGDASERTLGTLLAITVDVEADNEWQSRAATEYRGISALPRLQEVCDRYQVRPTYLVTFDVASDPASAGVLCEIAGDDRCEIGAHMHPWRTPPFHPVLDQGAGYQPYLYDYPCELQAQKMTSLTHCLEDVFQRRITSHRAGRWGIDTYGCDLLEDHGYIVDTSVTPLRNRRPQLGSPEGVGGPDFMKAPCRPYHPSRTEVSASGGRRLFEIPLSTGILGTSVGRRWHRGLVQALGSSALFGKTALRVLRKAQALHVVSLEPVRYSEAELLGLLDCLMSAKAPVLNMAFHSSELVDGASPNVRTAADLRGVWHRIDAVLDAVTSSDGTRSHGLTPTAVSLMQRE